MQIIEERTREIVKEEIEDTKLDLIDIEVKVEAARKALARELEEQREMQALLVCLEREMEIHYGSSK